MHPFMIVGAVLHATALVILAFFIWFAAARSAGGLRMLGNILGVWLIILAVAGVVMAIVAPGMGVHGRHMHPWPAAEQAAPANTTP